MTIIEVIAGLKEGRSFRHEKTDENGLIVLQRLDPGASENVAIHSVSSFGGDDSNASSGGTAEISIQNMDRQDSDGWIEIA